MEADLFQDAVGVVIRIAGPMLVLSMVVGILVALIQAVTQIHEQTLSFLLKLIVVVLCLTIGGGWMMQVLEDFTLEVYALMR